MPFRSKQQQKFMFATMPEVAKEWAEKTDFSKLPKKVRKKKKSKTDKNDVFQGKESLEAHGLKSSCSHILNYSKIYKDSVTH